MKVIDIDSPQGNAFVIMGAIQELMRRAGQPEDQIQKWMSENSKNGYDKLLQACKDAASEFNPLVDEDNQILIMASGKYHF